MTCVQQMLLTGAPAATPTTFNASSTFPGNGSGPNFYSVAFGAGVYVAVGTPFGGAGAIYSSTDAVTWTSRGSSTSPFSVTTWVKVIFNNSTFVAIGNTASSGISIAFSSNGTSWTFYTIASTTTFNSLSLTGNGVGSFQFCGNVGGPSTPGLISSNPTAAPHQFYTTNITSSAAWVNNGTLTSSSSSTAIYDTESNNAVGFNTGSSDALEAFEVLYGTGNSTLAPVNPSATWNSHGATNLITPDNTNFYLLDYTNLSNGGAGAVMGYLNSPGGWGSTGTTWTITNNNNAVLTGQSTGMFFSYANGYYFTGGNKFNGSVFAPTVLYATNPVATSGATSWQSATVNLGATPNFCGDANYVIYAGGKYVVVGLAYIGHT